MGQPVFHLYIKQKQDDKRLNWVNYLWNVNLDVNIQYTSRYKLKWYLYLIYHHGGLQTDWVRSGKPANEVVETKWKFLSSGLVQTESFTCLLYLIIQLRPNFCLCPAIPYNPNGNFLQRKLPLMSNCKKLPQIQWVSIKDAATNFDRKLCCKKYGKFTLPLLCIPWKF